MSFTATQQESSTGGLDGSWVLDLSENRVSLSPALGAAFGQGPCLEFEAILQLVNGNDRAQFVDALEPSKLQLAESVRFEARMSLSGAGTRWILFLAIRSSESEISVQQIDITDLRRRATLLASELDELSRQGSDNRAFIRRMKHDLRTPLNAMNGFADLLRNPAFGELSPRQLEFVDSIWESGRRLARLVPAALDVATIKPSLSESGPERMLVEEALDTICDLLSGTARKHQVDMKLEVEKTQPLLTHVPSLRFVLYCLVHRTVLGSEPGTTLLLQVGPSSPQSVCITAHASRGTTAVLPSGTEPDNAPPDLTALYQALEAMQGTLDVHSLDNSLGLKWRLGLSGLG